MIGLGMISSGVSLLFSARNELSQVSHGWLFLLIQVSSKLDHPSLP